MAILIIKPNYFITSFQKGRRKKSIFVFMLYTLVNGIFIDNSVKDIDGKYDYNEHFSK